MKKGTKANRAPGDGKATRPSVLCQILSTGQIRAELAVFATLMVQQKASLSLFLGHGGYMAMDRNDALNQWLDADRDEWIIQIDEDMVPATDILGIVDHAIEGGFDILGSTYLCGSDRGPMIAAKGFDRPCKCGGRKRKKPCPKCGGAGKLTDIVFPPKDGEKWAVEVDWVGTGCYAIHRKAALKMIEHYGRVFDFDFGEKGTKSSGCDVYMCRQAREIGLKVGVDRYFTCGHTKSATWAPAMDGRLVMPPWGSYWNGYDVPKSASERKPLNDVLKGILGQK